MILTQERTKIFRKEFFEVSILRFVWLLPSCVQPNNDSVCCLGGLPAALVARRPCAGPSGLACLWPGGPVCMHALMLGGAGGRSGLRGQVCLPQGVQVFGSRILGYNGSLLIILSSNYNLAAMG